MATHYQAWQEQQDKVDDQRWRERMARQIPLEDQLQALKRRRESLAMNLRTLTFLQDLASKNFERFGTGLSMVAAGSSSIAITSARIAELDQKISTMEAICASHDVHTN